MELNIYASYNISFDFSQNPGAYLTMQGLSPTPNPTAPDSIFEYQTGAVISAASVILSPISPINNAKIHLTVLDRTNTPIPGTESSNLDATMKSIYTFNTPLPSETYIRFLITSENIQSATKFLFCNATMTI